jgi:hypothetical protein
MAETLLVPENSRWEVTLQTDIDTSGLTLELRLIDTSDDSIAYSNTQPGDAAGEEITFSVLTAGLSKGQKHIVEVIADPGGDEIGLHPTGKFFDTLEVINYASVS